MKLIGETNYIIGVTCMVIALFVFLMFTVISITTNKHKTVAILGVLGLSLLITGISIVMTYKIPGNTKTQLVEEIKELTGASIVRVPKFTYGTVVVQIDDAVYEANLMDGGKKIRTILHRDTVVYEVAEKTRDFNHVDESAAL